MMTPEEMHDRVDWWVDANPLVLRDTLDSVIANIDRLSGKSAEEDDLLDELLGVIEQGLRR